LTTSGNWSLGFLKPCPDGKSEEVPAKAGEAKWISAGSHLPENLSDKRLELILVELKGKGATK
jgi:hypothetical protein